jgi:hypothetical protein
MPKHREPPSPPDCLERRYPSSQRGGTLIDERVKDLETHDRWRRDPDAYRPESCPTCQFVRMHLHDYRERRLRADPESPYIIIVRYDCPSCDAVWQVLPIFVARCLWRTWRVVETQMMGTDAERQRAPRVPERTIRRWWSRFCFLATFVLQVLAVSGALDRIGGAMDRDMTRADVIAAHSRTARVQAGLRIAATAGLLHRLAPGVRLM